MPKLDSGSYLDDALIIGCLLGEQLRRKKPEMFEVDGSITPENIQPFLTGWALREKTFPLFDRLNRTLIGKLSLNTSRHFSSSRALIRRIIQLCFGDAASRARLDIFCDGNNYCGRLGVCFPSDDKVDVKEESSLPRKITIKKRWLDSSGGSAKQSEVKKFMKQTKIQVNYNTERVLEEKIDEMRKQFLKNLRRRSTDESKAEVNTLSSKLVKEENLTSPQVSLYPRNAKKLQLDVKKLCDYVDGVGCSGNLSPVVLDRADGSTINLDTGKLLNWAEKITSELEDTQVSGNSGDSKYPASVVKKFCHQLENNNRKTLTPGKWHRVFAPTGRGKSVFNMFLALYNCVTNDETSLILVERIEECFETGAEVNHWIKILEKAGLIEKTPTVKPFFSERNLFEKNKGLIGKYFDDVIQGNITGQEGQNSSRWAVRDLDYSCELMNFLREEVEFEETRWFGNESCRELVFEKGDYEEVFECPFLKDCGRFRRTEEALQADLIIAPHMQFIKGKIRHPLKLQKSTDENNKNIRNNSKVSEVLAHAANLIIVDEVDAFQENLVDSLSTEILLGVQDESSTGQRNRTSITQIRGLLETAQQKFSDCKLERQVYGCINEIIDITRILNGALANRENLFENSIYEVNRKLKNKLFPGAQGEKVNPYQLTRELFKSPDDFLDQPFFKSYLSARDDLENHERIIELCQPLLEFISQKKSDRIRTESIEIDSERLQQSVNKWLQGVKPHGTNTADVREQISQLIFLRFHYKKLFSQLRFLSANFDPFFEQIKSRLQPGQRKTLQKLKNVLDVEGINSLFKGGALGLPFFHLRLRAPIKNTGESNQSELVALKYTGDPHGDFQVLPNDWAQTVVGKKRIAVAATATDVVGSPLRATHTKDWIRKPDAPPAGGNVDLRMPAELNMDDFQPVSGSPKKERYEILTELTRRLTEENIHTTLRELSESQNSGDRILLVGSSYRDCRAIARGLYEKSDREGIWTGEWRWLRQQSDVNNSPIAPGILDKSITRSKLQEFRRLDARLLIAPLRAVNRGVNILDFNNRSLLGAIYILARPVPPPGDPARLLGTVTYGIEHKWNDENCFEDLPSVSNFPIQNQAFQHRYDFLRNAQLPLKARTNQARRKLYSDIFIDFIQLIGRARRGIHRVSDVKVFLADPAFKSFSEEMKNIFDFWHEEGIYDSLKDQFKPVVKALEEKYLC